MENQQLELDLSSNSSLVLELTGNPWTDFGIVSFCEELRYTPFHCKLGLTPHEATLTIDVINFEKFEEWLNSTFQARWNQLYWLSRGAKILKLRYSSLNYDEGFINRNSQGPITEGERALIKEKWKGSTINDTMSLTQIRFNFIGIGNNADTFRTKQQENIRDFIQDWQGSKKNKVCEMSGRTCAKSKDLLQVVNPFANKSHLTRVRGVHTGAVVPKVGAIYYLLSLFTTLDENVPFVYEPSKKLAKLILPDIPNIELLTKVYKRLRENLKDDLGQNGLYPYTNLRTQMRVSNQFSLAISLFHNIFYEFSPPDDEESEGEWDFSSLVEQTTEAVRQLTRWVIIPFTKGQVVNFQNFHTVEVDTRLYDLIKPIDFKLTQIKIVPDILVRMSSRTPDGENALGQLNQAIATSTPSLMKAALFNLWKHQDTVLISLQRGKPHPIRLLQPFMNHFLEVNQVLDKNLREDLRALGTTIGTIFYKDVTLISKLFNISSTNAFRETINVVMFRLYKFSTGEGAKKVVPVKQERIDHILDALTDKNYKEIAETLSTYVCLNAYNAKVFESKSDNGGNQNDE